jgi:DnaJ-class molecular chaperone
MSHLNIRFEDLFAICTKCKGEGYVKHTPLASAAEGAVGEQRHSEPCAVCGGKGGELTDSGLAIKRLMEKIEAGA